MLKIAFVCEANICRSPMAETIFQTMVQRGGLEAHYDAVSMGLDVRPGMAVKAEVNQMLLANGYPESNHNATQLVREDYQNYNHFICMDYEAVESILVLFRGDPLRKVRLWNVNDPWMNNNFARTFDQVQQGCKGLLTDLERMRKKKEEGQ